MKDFRLIHGIAIKDTSKIKREYKLDGNSITLPLSADDYSAFFKSAVAALKEPVFFFIEAPEGDSDEYSTYYLDNCTLSVAKAILKRYGGILYSDGIIRFGFGSHITEDEIYMEELQHLSIYTQSTKRFEDILKKLGYEKSSSAVTLWDIIDENNPAERECVEFEDEGYPDIIENLTELGLYKNQ